MGELVEAVDRDKERDAIVHQLSPWAWAIDIHNQKTGENDRIFVNAVDAFNLYDLARHIGNDQAYQVFRLGAIATKRPWPEQDEQELYQAFETILRETESRIKDLPDSEDNVLWYSYEMLDQKKLTRERAAKIASGMLGKTFTTEAWRKRVDRWAEAQGHPPLGQTKRRPRKLSGH
jgi:hypothetical protein